VSSTNRGRDKRSDDFYTTPLWVVEALYATLAAEAPDLLSALSGGVLDPFAGDGAILRVCKARGAAVYANELREVERAGLSEICARVRIGDAFELYGGSSVPIVTNPPFSQMERALELFVRGGASAWLLRFAAIAGQRRNAFWLANPPAMVIVLPKRPSFAYICRVSGCRSIFKTGDLRGCGKTHCKPHPGSDSADYAWFVWAPPGYEPIRTAPAPWGTRLVLMSLETVKAAIKLYPPG